MKTHAILIILIMLISNFTTAQHTWENQLSSTVMNLNSVDFIGDSTGVAVGDAGTVIYTGDGGDNWITVATGVSAGLNGVAFADGQWVFAVGDMGMVLRSEDMGQSWQQVAGPGVEYDLLDISFDRPSGRGVITGQTNAIIVTDDFGETWTIVNEGYMSTFYTATMVNENMGVVMGWNSIFQPLLGYTLDWQTWDYRNFYPTWGGVMYEGLARAGKFTDETHGFIVGTYFVPGGGFMAPFGGWNSSAWEAQSFPQPLRGIDMLNNFGVMIGENAYLAESTDGGISWEWVNTGIGSVQLNDIRLTGNTGYVVGNGGTILKMMSNVGVKERSWNPGSLEVYPNPAKDMIHIVLPDGFGASAISVIDYVGIVRAQLKVQPGSENLTIFTGEWARGVYLVFVEGEQGMVYAKVILG